MTNTKLARKSHLAIVMIVARTDGVVEESETEWLKTVARSLELNYQDFSEAELMTVDEMVEALPDSKGDRALIFADCIKCGGVDGDLDDDELSLINDIKDILGFSDDDCEIIVDMILESASDDDIRNAFEDSRKSHLALVMMIARADGVMDESEMEWCKTVARSLGLNYQEFTEAELMTVDEILEQLPSSKGERALILADCINCSITDGDLDETESKMIGQISDVLEFSDSDYQRVIDLTLDNASDEVIRSAF
ncbi:MAG: hypothetical protein MK089_09300 [Phycisphaerales bacterium]|nr:hypothetical protein [Phycisphaerales bacterium]